ncbi:MAG: DUF3313 family protein [Gammaproteobacteria bacterium]|nr:DUF3313 family protein [Gammaproteobacteria bacterium]
MKHILAITLCLLAFPIFAEDASSGFLSDYARLEKEGSLRSRYMGYAAPGAKTISKTPVIYIAPVVRFPHDAKFGDLDDALVDSVLAYAGQQLRSQLAVRTRVVDDQAAAELTLDVALTAFAAQPAGKTALDLVPVRLITGAAKTAVKGKDMDATASIEMRLSQAAPATILRESMHELVGDSIGRSKSEDTHMTLEALKPALDRWVALMVNQIAPTR